MLGSPRTTSRVECRRLVDALYEFLGKKAPDEPFPHIRIKSEDYKEKET